MLDLTAELADKLLFAVPKKGRLHEPTMELLRGADIQFRRKNRLDIAICSNLPIALVFLPAADIAQFVGEGNVDLGVTGQDVLAEANMDSKVKVVTSLGFGQCKLCVQVPERSPFQEAQGLLGKRIVTSFENLTKKYFERLSAASSPTQSRRTDVQYISGSVEAACALGLADGIVDLVESGETMRAAQLHAIATVLESEAVLIANPRTSHPDLVQTIAKRIQGVIVASRHVLVKYNVERKRLKEASHVTPGNRAPTLSPLDDENWIAVEAMVPKKDLGSVLDRLTDCGATDVLVFNINNCRT